MGLIKKKKKKTHEIDSADVGVVEIVFKGVEEIGIGKLVVDHAPRQDVRGIRVVHVHPNRRSWVVQIEKIRRRWLHLSRSRLLLKVSARRRGSIESILYKGRDWGVIGVSREGKIVRGGDW